MWRSAHRVPATPQRQTRRGNLSVVVGVLVGQHDFRGGPDLAGLTAMRARYLRRPFPPLVSKVAPKPPDTLRRSTGQRLPDGGCAHVVDWILGHGTKNIPSTGHFVRAGRPSERGHLKSRTAPRPWPTSGSGSRRRL